MAKPKPAAKGYPSPPKPPSYLPAISLVAVTLFLTSIPDSIGETPARIAMVATLALGLWQYNAHQKALRKFERQSDEHELELLQKRLLRYQHEYDQFIKLKNQRASQSDPPETPAEALASWVDQLGGPELESEIEFDHRFNIRRTKEQIESLESKLQMPPMK